MLFHSLKKNSEAACAPDFFNFSQNQYSIKSILLPLFYFLFSID